jgi:hypothetical protein
MTDAPSAAELEREQLQAAAVEFGRNLRRWRRRQGWAQDTAAAWGQAIGSLCVHASQWSQLETASMSQPSPKLFLRLGLQNQQLASGEIGAIKDRALRDRVKAAEPVADQDGPWDATEFFSSYIGHLAWPPLEDPQPPAITDDGAAEWSEALRTWFQATAREAQREPLEAATEVMRFCDAEDPAARQQFQRVLLGFGDYSATELLEAWAAERPSERSWINAWRRSLGLTTDGPRPPWEA